jgi:polysaccharide export outer membrane protein
MPKQGLARPKLSPVIGLLGKRTAALILALSACLAGCAGSSGNGVFSTVGGGSGGNGAAQNDPATSTADSGVTAFASTTGTAAAADAADKLTSVANPGNAAYKIGPADVLDISVFNVPDLAKTVQVADDGSINYPLIGDVAVAGKTAHEIERELTQKLGAKYLRNPQVAVLVKEFNSQRVTVSGSVKTSGVYSIKGNTTLMQVLAMAGDLDMTVASGNVVVFRTINGQRSAARFDVDDIKAGKAEDPQVQPGDVVVVDTSNTKVALGNILKVLPLATTAAVFSGI